LIRKYHIHNLFHLFSLHIKWTSLTVLCHRKNIEKDTATCINTSFKIPMAWLQEVYSLVRNIYVHSVEIYLVLFASKSIILCYIGYPNVSRFLFSF